jgi:hypothetical protein
MELGFEIDQQLPAAACAGGTRRSGRGRGRRRGGGRGGRGGGGSGGCVGGCCSAGVGFVVVIHNHLIMVLIQSTLHTAIHTHNSFVVSVAVCVCESVLCDIPYYPFAALDRWRQWPWHRALGRTLCAPHRRPLQRQKRRGRRAVRQRSS